MAPLDRLEDYHNFTWGAIGYNHLDAALKDGKGVLDASLDVLVKRIDSQSGKQGQKVVTVFNPSGWERTETVTTGRIYPLPDKMKGVVVKDSAGRVMPSQVIKREVNGEQNLVTGEVAFRAEKVPSIGYDTYYLEFMSEEVAGARTELQVDTANLTMENSLVKVKLNPKTGAVSSLVDKRTGQEMLDAAKKRIPSPSREGLILNIACVSGKKIMSNLIVQFLRPRFVGLKKGPSVLQSKPVTTGHS